MVYLVLAEASQYGSTGQSPLSEGEQPRSARRDHSGSVPKAVIGSLSLACSMVWETDPKCLASHLLLNDLLLTRGPRSHWPVSGMRTLYQRSLIMTHLTAFLCPLVRRGSRCGAHPPNAGRNAASVQWTAASGGSKWPPGCVAMLARCARRRASHRAYPGGHFGPSNESLSTTFGIT